jgi:antitoxin component YwqK of YwqJK toxin-antitoxin module
MIRSTRYLFVLSTLLLYFTQVKSQSTAQPGLQMVNSGLILKEGESLQDEQKYKEALALYALVNPADSNYATILYDKALSSYQDSNLEAALRYCDTGLMSYPEKASEWYELKGNALNNLGSKDSSLVFYNKALQMNPKKYEAWFNKGLALHGLKRVKDAESCFQQCVLIYPYYSSAHYYLGVCAMELGNPVQSLMGFMTSLLINPQGRHAGQIVRMMTEIANVDDEVSKLVEAHQEVDADHFDVEQEVLMSKAALDKQYKLLSDVEDPIVRQVQAVLEKTDYKSDDPGFWMQYYIPYWKAAFAQGQFNVLMHQVFSGLKIKSIDEWDKHHESELKAIKEGAVTYFNKIEESEMLPVQARDTVTLKHLIEDGVYVGTGQWAIINKKRYMQGPWVFYYSNGQVKAKGEFDDKENKQGVWNYYYDNGWLKERCEMKNDVLEGHDQEYFDNGVMSRDGHEVNGRYQGEVKSWYYNGLLHFVNNYEGGKRNGASTEYTSDGFLLSVTQYVDGNKEGDFNSYYNNGQLSASSHFTKDNENGARKEYNKDGKLVLETTFVNGKNIGHTKTYYDDGELKTEFDVTNEGIDGWYKAYYPNGQVKLTAAYTRGKQDGKESDYTESGRLYEEDLYEKGKLKEVTCIGPDGKILSNSSIRSSAGTLYYYDSLGNKAGDGYYSFKGDKEGNFTYYFQDGKVSGRTQFKNGEKDGAVTHYYHSGQTADSLNYAQDREDGYFVYYYLNGQKKEEGFYDMGDLNGPFSSYDEMGNLKESGYYREGEKEGCWDSYSPAHRKTFEQYFSNGWELQSVTYDTLGNPGSTVDFTPIKTAFKTHGANGKVLSEGYSQNYHSDGPNKQYYFDQTLLREQHLKQGLMDSVYKTYYYNGKPANKGNYKLGYQEGSWYTYYESGKINAVRHYHLGNLEGVDTTFNEDGTIDLTDAYLHDDAEGPLTRYEDNNQVAYILYYHNGNLYAYSYLGKDGKPVPKIALPNGFGQLEAYYANGQKSASIHYVNGSSDGERTLWYSNGQLDIKGEKALGLNQGKHTEYFPNGKVSIEQTYYYDKLQGVYKTYYPSGVLKEELYYYNGELEGPCKSYDEHGLLVQTSVFYYDELQAVIK